MSCIGVSIIRYEVIGGYQAIVGLSLDCKQTWKPRFGTLEGGYLTTTRLLDGYLTTTRLLDGYLSTPRSLLVKLLTSNSSS